MSHEDSPKRPGTISWYFTGCFLVLGFVLSGLMVVNQSLERRALYLQLNELRVEQQDAIEEQSRLIIERSSIGSHRALRERALTELDMVDSDTQLLHHSTR